MLRSVTLSLLLLGTASALGLLGGPKPIISTPYCDAMQCTTVRHPETLPDPAHMGRELAYWSYRLRNGDTVMEGLSVGFDGHPVRYDYTGNVVGFIAFVRAVQDPNFAVQTMLTCMDARTGRGFNNYELTARQYTIGCASGGRYWLRQN